MEYTVLGKTGLRVSKLGLGGAPIGGDFGPTSDEDVCRVVDAALDAGVTFIDTAPLYGRGESERRLGIALKGKRDKVVLATKAVMRGEPYSYENTISSVERSLSRLQTDDVDLLQVHDAELAPFEQILNECVPALQQLQQQGKVRYLGVTTRRLELLMQYMRTGVFDTVQFYSRYMLLDHTAKDEVLPLARELGLGVINGSVLGMGILADTPAPFLQHNPALLEEADKRMTMVAFLRGPGPSGLVEPAMRFSLSCPDIHVTLTGTTSIEMIRSNASYCDGQGLTAEDQARVLSLFQGQTLF